MHQAFFRTPCAPGSDGASYVQLLEQGRPGFFLKTTTVFVIAHIFEPILQLGCIAGSRGGQT
jgi:hypothetical protein